MIKNLSKSPSLRTLGNKSESAYWSKSSKNNPNYSTIKDKQNQQSFEKSFHTAKSKSSKNQQNTLNRVVSLSNFSEHQSVNRKPLDELLKSSKQSSFYGMKKSQRSGFEKNPSFLKLGQESRHVKTLQSEIHNSKSRSRSTKRKGLECTLYEKSLQKKIQGSGIKSNIKLTTVKKRMQKPEVQSEIPKKDPKKVVLRKKAKESEGFTELESFNSINLNSTINKKCDESFQTIKIELKSLSYVQENIRSLSKHKRTALNQLNRSMSAIKQVCMNHKFDSAKKKSLSKQIKQRKAIERRSISKSKHSQLHQSISERIQSNLDKIHEKYKFITNYLSDVDIVGRLNSYDIAGKEECKWVLLLIDEVYEMIKHSRETKLKGIDYTRDYQYCSLQVIE